MPHRGALAAAAQAPYPRRICDGRGATGTAMTDAVSTVDVRTAAPPRGESRLRAVARTAFPFLVLGAMWEITAHAGVFPPRLFPPLEEIAAAFWRLTIEGILPRHVAETLARLFAGFALAAVDRRHRRHRDGPLQARRGLSAAAGLDRRADPRHRLCAADHAVVRARQFLRDPDRRLRLGVSGDLQHLDRREGGERNMGALGAGDGRRPAPPVPARDPAGRAAVHLHRAAARASRRRGASSWWSNCSPPCRGGSAG